MKERRKTRLIRVGDVRVGGGAPISVQSMTNTDTRDVRATIGQIRSLAREGCEIVRVAVPDEAAVRAFRRIRAASPIPVRIGVNAGSLEKDLLRKYGGPTPRALAESAARWVRFCEKARFTRLKFSLKPFDLVST